MSGMSSGRRWALAVLREWDALDVVDDDRRPNP
jgi:hypothetical protein